MRALRPQGRHLGVGLAMPGPFGVESMSFVGPTTMEGWGGVPIQAKLEESARLPAFIGVDSGAAALGERLYGAGRKHKDFFYVFFGVGLGGGTIRGRRAPARRLRQCRRDRAFPDCRRRRALPVRRPRLSRTLRLAGRALPPPEIRRHRPRRGLARRPRARAPSGLGRLDRGGGPLLARAVAIVENLLDPEVVIVGGGLPPTVIERLIRAAEPLPPSVSRRVGRKTPRLIRSEVGIDAALLGAAVLAISGVLSPRFGFLFADGDRSRDPIMARPAERPYLRAM